MDPDIFGSFMTAVPTYHHDDGVIDPLIFLNAPLWSRHSTPSSGAFQIPSFDELFAFASQIGFLEPTSREHITSTILDHSTQILAERSTEPEHTEVSSQYEASDGTAATTGPAYMSSQEHALRMVASYLPAAPHDEGSADSAVKNNKTYYPCQGDTSCAWRTDNIDNSVSATIAGIPSLHDHTSVYDIDFTGIETPPLPRGDASPRLSYEEVFPLPLPFDLSTLDNTFLPTALFQQTAPKTGNFSGEDDIKVKDSDAPTSLSRLGSADPNPDLQLSQISARRYPTSKTELHVQHNQSAHYLAGGHPFNILKSDGALESQEFPTESLSAQAYLRPPSSEELRLDARSHHDTSVPFSPHHPTGTGMLLSSATNQVLSPAASSPLTPLTDDESDATNLPDLSFDTTSGSVSSEEENFPQSPPQATNSTTTSPSITPSENRRIASLRIRHLRSHHLRNQTTSMAPVAIQKSNTHKRRRIAEGNEMNEMEGDEQGGDGIRKPRHDTTIEDGIDELEDDNESSDDEPPRKRMKKIALDPSVPHRGFICPYPNPSNPAEQCSAFFTIKDRASVPRHLLSHMQIEVRKLRALHEGRKIINKDAFIFGGLFIHVPCGYCGKRFTRVDPLLRHLRDDCKRVKMKTLKEAGLLHGPRNTITTWMPLETSSTGRLPEEFGDPQRPGREAKFPWIACQRAAEVDAMIAEPAGTRGRIALEVVKTHSKWSNSWGVSVLDNANGRKEGLHWIQAGDENLRGWTVVRNVDILMNN
ncbi:hypothetical protein CALCODRAFT_322335 [Calocera cornea HHB12733]|uniref:C2H2-type domain-containing protein n=1 Tax=Calocera cornea HHB12733 TaxID=1353952 RepID=A0A165F703_9BASI|nr:hypothetical protein CALCODRAFT_322335 [Calocera cornea HHB12733]